MKKCDIKGCNEKAEVFTEEFSCCKKHWEAIYNATYERDQKIAKLRGIL